MEKGDFTLSSGGKSTTYYNFRKATDEDIETLAKILANEYKKVDGFNGMCYLVGIRTMGWKIVKWTGYECSSFDPKGSEGVSWLEESDSYVLFDDVITTGNTIQTVIKFFGRKPVKIICLVNRSEMKKIGNVEIVELLPKFDIVFFRVLVPRDLQEEDICNGYIQIEEDLPVDESALIQCTLCDKILSHCHCCDTDLNAMKQHWKEKHGGDLSE